MAKREVSSPHPALSVIIAIVISILTASFLFSVGYAFVEQPSYEDYCALGPYPESPEDRADYEEQQRACSAAFDQAWDQAHNAIFYIVASLGVVLIISGLFVHNPAVDLRFYITSGVIFGALAAVLIATMQNWSVFTRFIRPLVLLGEIILVIVTAILLFRK